MEKTTFTTSQRAVLEALRDEAVLAVSLYVRGHLVAVQRYDEHEFEGVKAPMYKVILPNGEYWTEHFDLIEDIMFSTLD